MSYTPTTWTTGDTITATARNKIEQGIAGAGGGYDFVITCEYDGDDLTNIALDSGSYSDLLNMLQNGDIPSGILYIDNNGNGTRVGSLCNIIDLSANNIVAVSFITRLPWDDSIGYIALVINSDGTVDPD